MPSSWCRRQSCPGCLVPALAESDLGWRPERPFGLFQLGGRSQGRVCRCCAGAFGREILESGGSAINIIEAIDDPNLLGASIRDPESWKPWKALLAAAFGLPLSDDQLDLYRACTGRRVPPSEPAAYLWLVIGRRGGKSFAMALAFSRIGGNIFRRASVPLCC